MSRQSIHTHIETSSPSCGEPSRDRKAASLAPYPLLQPPVLAVRWQRGRRFLALIVEPWMSRAARHTSLQEYPTPTEHGGHRRRGSPAHRLPTACQSALLRQTPRHSPRWLSGIRSLRFLIDSRQTHPRNRDAPVLSATILGLLLALTGRATRPAAAKGCSCQARPSPASVIRVPEENCV